MSKLIFLFHGLHGSNTDLSQFIKVCQTVDNSKQANFLSISAYEGKTHEGLLKLAELSVEEIMKKYPNLEGKSISFVGHSLGGLIARVVVKMLDERNFFEKNTRDVFSTFASPNVGSQSVNNPVRKTGLGIYTSQILGKTGDDLMFNNDLLYEMSLPTYTNALNGFQKILLYSNLINDIPVPYCTSSMQRDNEFNYAKSIKVIEGTKNFVETSNEENPYDAINIAFSWKCFSKNFYGKSSSSSEVLKKIFEINDNLEKNLDQNKIFRYTVAILDPRAHDHIVCKTGSCFDIPIHFSKQIGL